MKLKDLLKESFGIGELPSSKLHKMKMSLSELMNEKDDAGNHLDSLESIVKKSKDLMGVGKELKRAGYKYDFSTSPVPYYTIKKDGFNFAIVNKQYVDKGDRVVGSIAIGMMENIEEALTIEGKDDFNASYSGVNINLKKGYKNYKEDDLMKLYSQLGKTVHRMKGVKSVDVVFEGVMNEEKYVVIDPKGNQLGSGLKIQAAKMAKSKGGEKKGYFVVPAKSALKARRAMEKYKFNFKNPKLQNMMSDLYFEDVVNEEQINEGASSEEKRIVMLAVRKIAKYRNVDINTAVVDVMRAAEELERDIAKGRVKK